MPHSWRSALATVLLSGAIVPAVALAQTPAPAPASPAPKSTAPASAEDARFEALSSAEWAWRKTQFADDEDSARHAVPHLPDVGPRRRRRA
jgi:hypothetical protein